MAGKVRTGDGQETVERRLGRIASRQHGVVTRAEALAAGVSANQVEGRIQSGALTKVHRGVYRLGHRAPDPLASYVAAVRACGDGSAVSGMAGAHLLGLLRATPPKIEIAAPSARSVPGLIVHRARRVPLELTAVEGIPVTTPPWTLLDIASRLDEETLGSACHEAWHRYRCGLPAVTQLAERRGRPPGSTRLLRMLGGDDPLLLSRLERRYLSLLRADRLELPRTNRRVGNHRVDCWWPHLRLVVELDSYTFHGSRRSWEADRRRDREARRLGIELIRYTWGDVFETPDEVRAEMRARLPRR